MASNFKYDNWNVDPAAAPALATEGGKLFVEYPYYDPDEHQAGAGNDVYFRIKLLPTTPRHAAPAKR